MDRDISFFVRTNHDTVCPTPGYLNFHYITTLPNLYSLGYNDYNEFLKMYTIRFFFFVFRNKFKFQIDLFLFFLIFFDSNKIR